MDMIWSMLAKLVNADQIGGWVRAATATGLGTLSGMGWFNSFVPFFENFKEAVAAAVSIVAVGIWSWFAKKFTPTPVVVNVVEKK